MRSMASRPSAISRDKPVIHCQGRDEGGPLPRDQMLRHLGPRRQGEPECSLTVDVYEGR